LFARATRRPSPSAASVGADEPRHHDVGRVTRDGLEALRAVQDLDGRARSRLAQRPRPGGVGHRHEIRAEARHLLRQLRDAPAGGQRADAEALGEPGGDLEGLLADRARAAEHREVGHRPAPPAGPRPGPVSWALVRPKRRSRAW
jgi:hypothetical protein